MSLHQQLNSPALSLQICGKIIGSMPNTGIGAVYCITTSQMDGMISVSGSLLSVSFPSVWSKSDTFQFIEFVGSTSLCYVSAMIDTTIGSFKTAQAAAYVGVTNIFLIGLFICALAPSSGGHVNPLITFTTMTTGLTGFSRGILYMAAQVTGASLAGGLIRGSFGKDLTKL